MWDLIIYVFSACVIAFVFKFVVGLFSMLSGVAVMALLGFKGKTLKWLLVRHPRAFFSYGVFFHTTVGALYSVVIALFTSYYVWRTGVNHVFYIVLSFFWGLTLISGAQSYVGTLLSSCLLGLGLFYFVFWFWGPLISWALVLAGSLLFYLGRINIIQHQMLSSGEYDQIVAELERDSTRE